MTSPSKRVLSARDRERPRGGGLQMGSSLIAKSDNRQKTNRKERALINEAREWLSYV